MAAREMAWWFRAGAGLAEGEHVESQQPYGTILLKIEREI